MLYGTVEQVLHLTLLYYSVSASFQQHKDLYFELTFLPEPSVKKVRNDVFSPFLHTGFVEKTRDCQIMDIK